MREAVSFSTGQDESTGKYHVIIQTERITVVSLPLNTLAEAEALRDREATEFVQAMDVAGNEPHRMEIDYRQPSRSCPQNN